MSETGIVILTRYNSSRLPGKALIQINGKPVLEHIIDRLTHVIGKNEIIIATSTEVSDDPIADFSKKVGIDCYRGSLINVALRFFEAAKFKKWKYAARINGDNVFVDSRLLKEMIEVAEKDEYDFISNVKGRTYPKGMSIEIVRLDYYSKNLERILKSEKYREHVTAYFYEHEESKKHFYFFNNSIPEVAGIQLALDTPEDLIKTKEILNKMEKPFWKNNLSEIFLILKKLNYVN